MRRTDRRTDSNSTPSISQTLTLAGPTKYPRVIRQNCRPQGVKYLNATRTASRQTAPIAYAMAVHPKESTSAVDQLIEGLNGVGPNFDVSLLARHPGSLMVILPREGTRGLWIGCREEHRAAVQPGRTCR